LPSSFAVWYVMKSIFSFFKLFDWNQLDSSD
jgi:hypothetical protein